MNSKITPLKRKRITNLLNKITEYKVVYLSANIGCGKTFEVQELEEKMQQKFIWYNIQKEDNENKYFIDNIDTKVNKIDSKIQIIVIEDLYLLINEEKRKQLAKYIETTDDNIHFIICTRNILTPEYRQFVVENKLLLITNKELDFTKEDIKELFENNNIEITYEEIENIMIKITYGYAVGIIYLLSKLLEGSKFGEELLYESEQEMFEYIQCAILDKFDSIHRRFLVKLSLLDEITVETATALTGNLNSKNILKDLSDYGSFLINNKNKYILNVFLKKVLVYEIHEKFSKEEINELYNNIASYYEQKDKSLDSVKYYLLAQEYEHAAIILEKETKNSIAITSYKDIENYIKQLPENVIIRHSALCSNLCIMYSIKYKLEEANIWYEKLKQLKKELPKDSLNLREIDENILYAKISLPNTKDIDLVTDLKVLFRVIGDRNKIS